MPWKTYEEILEAAKKWLLACEDDFPSRYDAIEFYINATAKIALAGDISVLHRLRKDLEAESKNEWKNEVVR